MRGTVLIPIIGLQEKKLPIRILPLAGCYYSMISLGKCNFRCPYCVVGGYLIKKDNLFPYCQWVTIKQIKGFIDEQAERGYAIRISGGEPSETEEVVLELLKYLKEKKIWSSIDTNGSHPEVIERFSLYADEISIDLKGIPRMVEILTGVKKDISWEKPLLTIKMSRHFPSSIEVKTVMFDFVSWDDLLLIHSLIPPQTYWILKSYSPRLSFLRKNSLKERIYQDINVPWLKSHPLEKVITWQKRLVKMDSSLRDRLVIDWRYRHGHKLIWISEI